ncbi:YDR341C-like protein [Cunninghamella echinulata]|nr:YDR341C-like protein [Cunninghamella echinulata]
MNTAQLFRQAIAKQLSIKTSCNEAHALKLLGVPKVSNHGQFSIPIPRLLPQESNANLTCQTIVSKIEPNEWISKVTAKGPFLHFDINLSKYIQNTLQQVHIQGKRYGTKNKDMFKTSSPPTVAIDYSSPNIAKPFHAGHLRSTILGSFIKRSHEALGYRVIGINYLGDWGKQYGLLAVGYEKYGVEEKLMKDPIHHLYEIYVAINKEACMDNKIDKMANDYFKRMEQGDQEALTQWKRFRDLSITSYQTMYQRLNIHFEEYSGESQTEKYIQQVYDVLEAKQLLKKKVDENGTWWWIDLEPYGLGKPVIRRADGTTLYITRDIASLMLRSEKYAFDKAIYVVGTEQSLYLQQLFKIWELIHDQQQELYHANFGRIQGMSTRKGTVVFLQDILDTAKEKMMENMKQDGHKYKELMDYGIQKKMNDEEECQLKGAEAVEYVADQLGTSAVIIQDMIAKRIKNYTFSWERMISSRGYTGVYLQFTYARLCGIERNNVHLLQHQNQPIDSKLLLQSKEAIDLVLIISQYPDILQQSCDAMEPCTLVQYLFKLSHSISQAVSTLRVKDVSDIELATSRMILFSAAKITLANGLSVLGIDPLERI